MNYLFYPTFFVWINITFWLGYFDFGMYDIYFSIDITGISWTELYFVYTFYLAKNNFMKPGTFNKDILSIIMYVYKIYIFIIIKWKIIQKLAKAKY
jgi:hypothetical protein